MAENTKPHSNASTGGTEFSKGTLWNIIVSSAAVKQTVRELHPLSSIEEDELKVSHRGGQPRVQSPTYLVIMNTVYEKYLRIRESFITTISSFQILHWTFISHQYMLHPIRLMHEKEECDPSSFMALSCHLVLNFFSWVRTAEYSKHRDVIYIPLKAVQRMSHFSYHITSVTGRIV